MKCKHVWERVAMGPGLHFLKCNKCYLRIEIYSDHVSVWDYTKGHGYIGGVDFPIGG